MTLTLDTRARMLLLTLLFVVAAGVAGFMWFQRMHGSDNGSPAAAPLAPAHVTPKPVTKPVHAAKPKVSAVATHPKPKPKPKPAAQPAPSDQLPAGVRRALAAGNVVVVALYDPKAKIDGTALAEAKAGARLADSAFVKIDVRSHGVDSLNARYGAVQDPAVLVLSPPGTLVVRLDGFADRDTVAQAALNAVS